MFAEKETIMHICITVFFLLDSFLSCHHLFSLTENMIISLPPRVVYSRKSVTRCVCGVRRQLQEGICGRLCVHVCVPDTFSHY